MSELIDNSIELNQVESTFNEPSSKCSPGEHAMLVFLEHANELQGKIQKEFGEVKTCQDQISILRKSIRLINANTNDNGELNAEKLRTDIVAFKDSFLNNENLQDNPKRQETLIKQFEEIVSTIKDLTKDKRISAKTVRDQLHDDFQMTIKDLDAKYNMQVQAITRLNGDRQDVMQIIKSIMRPENDTKIKIARELKG